MKKNSIVVGLDIGTTKVCVVIGEMTEQGVEIIGVGSHASQGLRKGALGGKSLNLDCNSKAIFP